MRKIKNYNSFSIRTSMIVVFILFMLSTVGVIGYIVFSNWFSSAEKTVELMAEDMNGDIFNKVDAFVNLPIHINEMNSKFIENGIVNIDNETERDRYFVGVMRFLKDEVVYSFSIGTENGDYYGARTNQNHDIEIMRNNAETGGHSWYYSVTDDLTAGELVVEAGKFDARTRDWYKAAKETQKPVFSPIYKHFVMDDLTVSATYPIFDKKGEFHGVLGTHITLTKINKYLEEIAKDKNGLAFIIDKNSGELIANSLDIENFKTLEDGKIKRIMIEEIENKAISQAYQTYKSTAENNIRVKNEGDKLYISFTEYNKAGLDWLVITAFPESLLVAGIFTNMKLAVLLTLIALLVSIVTYWLLTNKFFKPIDSLIETTEKFSHGNLTERATILRNDEIGRISISFNKMADLIYEHVNNLEGKVRERTFNLLETNKELQENKEQLENSENHFQNLFTNSPVMKAIVKDNRCIQVNKSWTEHTGFSHEEILSIDVNDLPILKDLSVYFTSFCKAELIKEEHLLLTYTTKSNENRSALINYVKIKEANTTQYLIVAIDITKQQQYEDSIAKLDRLHTISQVAASIGHEVRNPLTTIKGFTQLFLLKPEFLPYQTFLDLIIDELNRANDIISDFLSLAKIDKSIMEVASINDEINEILILLHAHALKENVTLVTNFETISSVNICKNEFRQVILNIVNNAIEVSEHGDLVSIKTYETDSHVIVSISDQGKGIPKEIQDKIGEPFYTTKSSGTGLGLPVCQTILHRHSGKMAFETGNNGTTFYLHFPIAGISDAEKKVRIS